MNSDVLVMAVDRAVGELLRGVHQDGRAFITRASVVLAELVEHIGASPADEAVDHELLMAHAEQRIVDLLAQELEDLDTRMRQRVRELLVNVARGVVAGLAAVA